MGGFAKRDFLTEELKGYDKMSKSHEQKSIIISH